jgi:hypothetical protein
MDYKEASKKVVHAARAKDKDGVDAAITGILFSKTTDAIREAKSTLSKTMFNQMIADKKSK